MWGRFSTFPLLSGFQVAAAPRGEVRLYLTTGGNICELIQPPARLMLTVLITISPAISRARPAPCASMPTRRIAEPRPTHRPCFTPFLVLEPARETRRRGRRGP